MSDDELDRDWKPSNRPQSTMARSFSAALDTIFDIDNSLADLDATLEEKKKAVSTQTSELEALEARLRATEERLKARQANSQNMKPGDATSPRQRAPIPFDEKTQQENKVPGGQTGAEYRRVPSRPSTAKQTDSYGAPPMPGALPPTPGASDDGEYMQQHGN